MRMNTAHLCLLVSLHTLFLNFLELSTIMENNLEIVSFMLLCNYEADIVNVEICWDTDEFKLFSRTCAVTYSTMIINNTMNCYIAQLNKIIFKGTFFINYKRYVIGD